MPKRMRPLVKLEDGEGGPTPPAVACTRDVRSAGEETKSGSAIDPLSTTPPPSISGVTVWVLVRAEYDSDDYVMDSEVLGVYASEALARKAKTIESRHMNSKFGERWGDGDQDEWCAKFFHTSLAIHAKMIQDSVHHDDDGGDDDDDDDDDDADDDDDDDDDAAAADDAAVVVDDDDESGHRVNVVPNDD